MRLNASFCQKAALCGVFLCVVSVSNSNRAESVFFEPTEFTSADVATASASLDCIDYCIVGICIQLICTMYGCTIDYSPYVQHGLPDLVVTAHNAPGNMPWVEAKAAYGTAAATAAALLMGISIPTGGGGGGHHTNPQNQDLGEREEKTEPHQTLLFRDTSVIGNPEIAFLREKATVYLCPSNAEPFYPYFISEFDTLFWRSGLFSPEVLYPATWIPGFREVSDSLPLLAAVNSWGSVHPRHGFINTAEEPKGVAVLAQRSVDIVTRDNQPHVYSKVDIDESDEKTDSWQMLAPIMDEGCSPFGVDDNYAILRSSQDGNYGWLYWPRYECCAPEKGILIGIIDIDPICYTDIFGEEDDSNDK